MKQFRTFILFAAVAIFGAVACKKPDSLSLTDAEVTAPVAGLTQDLVFSTNVPWSVQSSANWVSVNPSSGDAGDIKAKLTVEANDTYEDRSATVVVTAGSLMATLTVNQTYARVFELQGNAKVEVDFTAQTIEFAVNSNLTYQVAVEAGCNWITPVASKAAPKVDRLGFNVAENESVEAREAKITITPSEGTPVVCTVAQAADAGKMIVTSVKYISNRQGTYDSENWTIRNHAQYVVDASTADGTIRLVLTTKRPAKPLEGLPEIPFETDSKDSYADSTVTVGATGHEYFSNVVVGGATKDLTDVMVDVKKVAAGYAISAKLADEAGKVYDYHFEGALPAIVEESKGLEVTEINYKGDYYTHFASGAAGWNFSIHPSCETADAKYVYSLNFDIYAPKADAKAIPTGTFKFISDDDIKEIDSKYANGKIDIPAGTFSSFYGYSDFDPVAYDYGEVAVEDGTVAISQSAAGTYKFDFDLKLVITQNNATTNYNFKKTYDNVVVPDVTDNHVDPVEDGDFVFTEYIAPNPNYSLEGYGQTYAEYTADNKLTALVGWSGGDFGIQMVVSTDVEYVYNTNVSGKYSDAPLPAGTYTFCKYASEAKGKFIANLASVSYCKITNSYTGTALYIKDGSITFSDKDVKFDLYAATADGSKKAHFTGGFDTKIYFGRDYSTNASRVARANWNTAFLYPQTTEPFDPIFGYTW